VPSDDQPRSTPLIPDVTKAIPEVTRAAARWVRPHVPPFVTNVIDAGTQPLRTVRQVIDEVEEISFSFKRTHKVTVEDEVPVHTSPQPEPAAAAPDAPATHWVEYSVPDPYAAYPAYAPGYGAEHLPWGATPPSPALAAGEYPAELPAWEGQQELPGPYGPPQLPPAQ